MFARTSFLWLLILSLAIGPARVGSACAPLATGSCDSCCADATMNCCAAPVAPASQSLPQTAPSADEGRLIGAPTTFLLYVQPETVVERPSIHKRAAARMPAEPRLEVTCIRLI